TNESLITNDGFKFIRTIIIAGNGTCTNIRTGTDFSIPEIGEVVGFRAYANCGIFHFYKVTDMHLGSKLRTRTLSCKRGNLGIFTNDRMVRNAQRLRFGPSCNCGIFDDAAGANFNMIAQLAITFDNLVDINLYILTDSQIATQIKAARINQMYTLLHQLFGLTCLKLTF